MPLAAVLFSPAGRINCSKQETEGSVLDNQTIYQDIATRTGGNIYIGVVGPVRTGKSTFIKRFMETLVLPGIEDVYMRERAVSGSQ